LCAAFSLTGCGGDRAGSADSRNASGGASGGEIVFREAAEATGLVFTHDNGMIGQFYLPEITGAGGAMFDYDNDGDLDVYLVQGVPLGSEPGDTGTAAGQSDRLFRNDLRVEPDGSRTLRFVDVTETSGVDATGYGMGVATGDYDNDGWVDLYVTNFGPNQLLRNRGDGTFEDVTAAAGAGDSRWSVPATFFDYDHDGWLDLYVGNYVDYSHAVNKICRSASGVADYCSPNVYGSVLDRLLHNRGDGTFENVTTRAGLSKAYGNALGVIPTDFDNDGFIDLFVANDGTDNQLWMNRGDGTFADEALLRGCAVNMEGRAEASMGVDAGDFDRDGDEDLFITHLKHETNTLYLNRGDGSFDDHSVLSDLGAPSRDLTGFGTSWFDYDLDGWLDLLVVNGAVQSLEELVAAGDPYPLHQPDQLYRNLGNGRFRDVSETASPYFRLSDVGRGAVFGDLDNDGDTDIIVCNNNGPVRLLINEAANPEHGLGVVLMAAGGPRDPLGARVGFFREGEPTLWRRVRTAGSYASAGDPRVLVGLGGRAPVDRVRVEWPSGRIEEWNDVATGAYVTLEEGAGRPVTSEPGRH
jgi:hypothetical protein